MKKYKLIACDLDGTLFSPDQTVSQENLDAIEEIKARGVEFVPCTGRTLAEMGEVISRPHFRYFVYSNGAAIFDSQTGKTLDFGITAEEMERVFDVIHNFSVFTVVHKDGKVYAENSKFDEAGFLRYQISDYYVKLFSTSLTLVDSVEEVCKSGYTEMFCLHFEFDEDIDKCWKMLSDLGVKVATSCPHEIEAFSPNASKGKSLARLAEMLEIDISDVIGVGDSVNDLTLLGTAGLGISVANGAPELKKIADVIAVSNEEHIAKFLLENYIK